MTRMEEERETEMARKLEDSFQAERERERESDIIIIINYRYMYLLSFSLNVIEHIP